jgi:cell division transport system ATP-binding protein
MTERHIVSLKDAQIYQGKNLILSNVNFEVGKGEFVYLIGKTGSGKSSLLKTLYGDVYLKKGSGFVAGFDLTQLKWQNIPLLRRNLGIVFQDFKLLYSKLPVGRIKH